MHDSTSGQPMWVAGWAIDAAAASGPGVDAIDVYAVGSLGNVIFLGVASYGAERTDIAASYGEQFRYSGFNFNATGLPPDTYQISAYARSVVTQTFNQATWARVTIPAPNVVVNVDVPSENQTVGQSFSIGGWAIDLAHPTTSGVSFLHVYALPANGSPAIFLGQPATGSSRPDVGAAHGARFTPSGWDLTVTGLPAGTYTLVFYPWSTVIDGFWYTGPVTRVIHVQ